MVASYFVAGTSFLVIVLDRLGRQKKVVARRVKQVVVLYSNDCTRIRIGRLIDEWLSYRGGCLNRFDCNALS